MGKGPIIWWIQPLTEWETVLFYTDAYLNVDGMKSDSWTCPIAAINLLMRPNLHFVNKLGLLHH
jgi:hypothetical protein